jgi:hypothetical protein
MRFPLGKDPLSGIERWMEYDPLTDTTTEFATQDVNTALEVNNDLRNDDEYWKRGKKNEFAHYASIPALIYEKWIQEGMHPDDTKAMLKKLNSPEYAYLKVTTKTHA